MTAPRVLSPPQETTAAPGALSSELLRSDRERFDGKRGNRLAQNAVTQVSIDDVALDHGIATSVTPTFSTVLDDWSVTNQKKTGRCWMFAGLNLFRVGAMKVMNLKDFEFSQSY